MITYQQQYDKLSYAYIEGKVDPLDPCACFIGNLLNNQTEWSGIRDLCSVPISSKLADYPPHMVRNAENCIAIQSDNLYTPEDIIALEMCFLESIVKNGGELDHWDQWGIDDDEFVAITERDEEALFIAFSKTLEMLREIHIRKGEVIDNPPILRRKSLAV